MGKQEQETKTKDLDQKWKEMAETLRNSGTFYAKKVKGNDEDETEETDDYNKFMKELSFEPKKAKAQDRLKTDEEIITDQKDLLEKMEELRQKRMRGEDIEENEQDEQGEENEQDEHSEHGEEEEEEGSEDDQFSDL